MAGFRAADRYPLGLKPARGNSSFRSAKRSCAGRWAGGRRFCLDP